MLIYRNIIKKAIKKTIIQVRTIYSIIISIYYTKKNKLIIVSCGNKLKINRKTRLTGNTYLGNNCNFNGLTIYGRGKVVIGDNFHSGTECMFITDNHDYDNDDFIPYGERYVTRNIIIEDNVWIGSRVILLGGITIGEGAIIQAGALVVSDIPKYAIAGGNPAKVFKYRNINHYNELKRDKKFY